MSQLIACQVSGNYIQVSDDNRRAITDSYQVLNEQSWQVINMWSD